MTSEPIPELEQHDIQRALFDIRRRAFKDGRAFFEAYSDSHLVEVSFVPKSAASVKTWTMLTMTMKTRNVRISDGDVQAFADAVLLG